MEALTFNKIANETFNQIIEISDRKEFDYDLINDVLCIYTTHGEYVVNKHAPTEQVWLSSPMSGGHHFIWDQNLKSWISAKGQELFDLLDKEFN
ncbi:MAG: iron donor protein CyaY [Sphingobacteriia bacterium]|nr:iron donor protein CyaY [Sphingobacteriia bacterium]